MKFVKQVEQICYNGAFARSERRDAVFVTERAVFRVGPDGLELFEVAPGIDVERDIMANMAFRPAIASDLREMDARLFSPAPMNLGQDVGARARGTREPRRMLRDGVAACRSAELRDTRTTTAAGMVSLSVGNPAISTQGRP